MSKPIEKKLILWMGLGLLIPILLVVIAFLAAKSDAENKKEYERQHAEIAKKFAQQKQEQQTTLPAE